MATPGTNSNASRLRASIPLLALLLIGCGNPFSEFYSGTTVTELQKDGTKLLQAPAADPQVIQAGDFNNTIRQWAEDGWMFLGQSNWIGADVGSLSQAKEQAKRIGASVVIWSYQYMGSSSSAMPITTPTTSTTYGSGNAYGGYGAASWSGSATTYGTQTTYVPITIHRFEVAAAFLCRPANPPIMGLFVRRMTPEEQQRAGTIQGSMVDLVIRNSPAAAAGILPGDVMVQVGSMPVSDEASYQAAVIANKGKQVDVEWIHRGEKVHRTIQLNN
jgi:hypothetical protein